MKRVKSVFEVNFVEDLIYQGIKFLIYDYFTTNRGELRKSALLAKISSSLHYFYGLVGYNTEVAKKLVSDSLRFIQESKNFTEATSQILANNTINSLYYASKKKDKK